MNPEFFEKVFKPLTKRNDLLGILISLLDQETYGSLELAKGKIVLKGNFLTDDKDVKKLRFAAQTLKKLAKTNVFKKLGAELIEFDIEKCKKHKADCVQYWSCFFRHLSFIWENPLGTCRMGRTGCQKSVVDENLKVFGCENLRVVGQSVFPFYHSGIHFAQSAMIAEKISDGIKQDWGKL